MPVYKVIYIAAQNGESAANGENTSQNNLAGEMGYVWRNQRQSTNIIDIRTDRFVYATGYLTWNVFFHLASNTPFNIANALIRNGFNVFEVSTTDRDRRNSQYNFFITLRVYNQYTIQQIQNSLFSAFLTVAHRNSIRFNAVWNEANFAHSSTTIPVRDRGRR